MGRPRKTILTVSKVLDRGTWNLAAGRAPFRVKFSIRHLVRSAVPRLAEIEAERLRLELSAAMARDEWPAWGKRIPAIQRLIRRQANARLNGPAPASDAPVAGTPPPSPANAAAYDRYADHLSVTVVASWKASQLATLRELSGFCGVPLLHVEPAHVQSFLDHILKAPGPREAKVHEAALRRWRQNSLRDGIDPDTGGPLRAGTHKPSGTRSLRAPKSKPEPPKGRSIATRNHALRGLRKFFNWAIREGMVGKNPTEGIRRMQEPAPDEILVLTHDERLALLDAASGQPDGLAVAVALYAGLRRSEIIRADWKHIRLDNRVFRVPRVKRAGDSTPKIRNVPISAKLAEWLEKIPEKKRVGLLIDRWATSCDDTRRRDAGDVMKTLSKVPALSGIDRRKFNWNVLRHTFCTGHLDAGVAPGVVCQWSGHTEKVFWTNYAGHIREYDARIDMIDGAPKA